MTFGDLSCRCEKSALQRYKYQYFTGVPLILSSRHARLSISLLLPSKTRILPRFWPLFSQHCEQ